MGVEIFLFVCILIAAVVVGLVLRGSLAAIFANWSERRRRDRLQI